MPTPEEDELHRRHSPCPTCGYVAWRIDTEANVIAGCEVCDLRNWRERLAQDLEQAAQKLIDAEQGSPFDRISADVLAAAVDEAVRRGALDARCLIADCRLDYGDPFTADRVAKLLGKYRGHAGSTAAGNEYDAVLAARGSRDLHVMRLVDAESQHLADEQTIRHLERRLFSLLPIERFGPF